jgi:hypothetical protein
VWRACVSRIHKQPVNATWSDSLDGQADGGERVRRVTVLGAVQVGFHERGGRWFADGIWCAAQ